MSTDPKAKFKKYVGAESGGGRPEGKGYITELQRQGGLGNSRLVGNDIINNPTHLTLRLLFLDDDDLPMR